MTPSWDLPTVLKAFSQAPFETLEQVDMNMVSLKTALLMALTSAKRVMHALSVNKACVQVAPDGLSVQLHPNSAFFFPKVVGPCICIEQKAFNPLLFTSGSADMCEQDKFQNI